MGPDSNYEAMTSLFVSDFIKAQNAAGLTPAFLATALKRLIKAKKTDTFKGTVENFDGEGNLIRNDVVIYSKPMTDNATNLKALQMALNIRGVQTSSPQTSLSINNPGEVNFMGAVAKILGANGDPVDD
jgi:small nuclear ribonucleoprotein (snRNP)-like protein